MEAVSPPGLDGPFPEQGRPESRERGQPPWGRETINTSPAISCLLVPQDVKAGRCFLPGGINSGPLCLAGKPGSSEARAPRPEGTAPTLPKGNGFASAVGRFQQPSRVHLLSVSFPGKRPVLQVQPRRRQGRIWHSEASVQNLGKMPTDPSCNLSSQMWEEG